jgi:hypothetical protein
MKTSIQIVALSVIMCAFGAPEILAQEIRGRVVDSSNGQPVATAGVFLLDVERNRAAVALADSMGRFVLTAPAGGEYFIAVQRIGYFEFESPLIAVADGGIYPLDLEIRPEPIRLDPLLVTIRNENLERWLSLKLGGNPNTREGFRALQGVRLEEAKFKSDNNTEMLRWLLVGVANGMEVCLGSRMPKVERGTGRILPPPCGKLFVDDQLIPAEHIDQVDMESVAVVIVLPPDILFYTRAFDWTVGTAR